MLWIAKIFQAALYWPIFLMLRLFVNYRVEGQENLLGFHDRPLIFAANHASFIDGMVSAAAMPRDKIVPWRFFPLRFLIVERFMSLWSFRFPFAIFSRLSGGISVRKAHGDYEVSLGSAVKALRAGNKVWIFPEGKFTLNGRLQKGRRGIGYLHQMTGAPIVPVYIEGNFDILSERHIWKRGAEITVRIGSPMSFAECDNYDAVAESVMDEIHFLSLPITHAMSPKLKILAVHGFWRRGIFWREFVNVFRGMGVEVITPDIKWSGDYSTQLLKIIKDEKPDVIVGMSFGGYLIQQVMEFISPDKVGLCVLIAPVGPHGLGMKTFLKMLKKGKERNKDDSEFFDDNPINAWSALPFCGSVWGPIRVPTLVVSGGRDKFVSPSDAARIARYHKAEHKTWSELNHNDIAKNEEVIRFIADWIEKKSK